MSSFAPAAAAKKPKDNREQSDEEEPRNEPSLEHQSAAQRVLAKAIERERTGLKDLPATRCQLLSLFGRIERLGSQIDEAFGGQPFLRNVPPDSPANRRRFNAFFDYHRKVTGLLWKAIELWMLTCGMKREDNWVPLLIAQMHQNGVKSQPDANGNLRCRVGPLA